ncbi:MAG: hypothetical protein JWR04_2329 [Rhodoglobus sp.]|nr:hypothetical protein [Rhodoglobus sp.]
MTAATPAPAAPATVPGKTLGIVGLILAFLAAPIGLILSIVAKVQSRAAGVKNGPATAGIIISIIVIALYIIIPIVAFGAIAAQCADLGPGVHTSEDGISTITCG